MLNTPNLFVQFQQIQMRKLQCFVYEIYGLATLFIALKCGLFIKEGQKTIALYLAEVCIPSFHFNITHVQSTYDAYS